MSLSTYIVTNTNKFNLPVGSQWNVCPYNRTMALYESIHTDVHTEI